MNTSIVKQEDRLILLCCRTSSGADLQREVISLAGNSPDWDYIFTCIHKNGVEAMFYSRFTYMLPAEVIPSPYSEKLKQAYYLNLRRNILLEQEIERLGKVLTAHNIRFAIIKGMSIANYAYGDLHLRQMSDIDMLVRPEELESTYQLLQETGYKAHSHAHTRWHRRNMQLLAKHLPDLSNGTNTLDLHARLLPEESSVTPFVQSAWARMETVSYGETFAGMLCPAHQLIYTTVHLHDHRLKGGFQLRLYCDIAEIMRNVMKEKDWVMVAEEAGRYKLHAMLTPHLALAGYFLDAPIPSGIFSGSELEVTEQQALSFLEQLAHGKLDPPDTLLRAEFFRTIKRVNGLPGKFRYTLGIFFPSRQFMIHRYHLQHPGWYFLYYFVRLWRIFSLLLRK